MDFLIKYLKEILDWLLGFIGWSVVEVVKLLLAGLAAIINAIPVPDWVAHAGDAISNFPPGAAYFLGSLHIATGCTILVSAYTIRFLIRRIPFIG